MAHDARHEERLQQMLCGDLASDEAALARLAGCEECARLWRELSALVASIDDAGRDQREVLAEAAGLRAAPGSDRVAATLAQARSHSFATRDRAKRRVSPWTVVLAAAALLVAGFFVTRALIPDRIERSDTTLGGEIEFRETYASLSAGVPIRWRFAKGSDKARFEVHLLGRDGSAYAETKTIWGVEWTPTVEEVRGMPPSVDLYVLAIDMSKNQVGSSAVITLSVSR